MNWISNYVRPRFRALVAKSEVPDNLWEKCDSCGQMIFHRELAQNLRVCPHCSHHMRIPVNQRLELLFDEGQYQTIELPEAAQDPLRFRDRRRYTERLREARAKTEAQDAIVVAHGTIGGGKAVVAAFNFAFMGGSMGVAVGEGLLAAAKLACLQEAPLIAIPASGGARMQEGILSLMQMPRTTIAVEMVKDAGLPYIVLLSDPTTGGVSASFAMLGDIAVSEPGAVIGFAGARVIEETIREKLPEGFQRAEYLLEHGMIDMVVDRRELRETLGRTIKLLCRPEPEGEIVPLPGTDLDVPEKTRVTEASRPDGQDRPAE
ncbi:acetyl-CoA carboxylase, carboxyltransferase subunit beta [Ferruginivarius sediminum]|uniref:Acetyl-coenzyme A carboxylase carboxyl transferase subunit beta n=1 Tax=Ferruginivarius sediminum TaxID=2661937 RepID=A0A369T799_9PROT|nr:acetyl-CoA carboxylase, carboxyltransferase subunit beta [Ferruginivarius sediminum]RDD60344.1 acetyl-CoA carboxylase carboxyltransferase subunit beta [Ferruginivarius sediminum]